jgi:DNA polymerase-3 subunit epsilon
MLSRLTRWWYRRRTASAAMQAYLEAPLPRRNDDARTAEYLAVDLETTGLNPARDVIVSIGWVPILGGRIRMKQARHLFLAIDGSVAQSATIHHIRDSDLTDGGSEAEALRHMLRALQGRVLLVHHAPMDLRFLHAACRRHCDVPLHARVVDTLALAHARRSRGNQQPQEGELRLHALREAYNLPRYPVHDALTDALATAELLLAMLPRWAGDAPLPLKTLLR